VLVWWLDFEGKISPSEMHGKKCNPHISETVRPRAKRSENSNRLRGVTIYYVLVDEIRPTSFDQNSKYFTSPTG